jgi:hypothetical protein
VTSSHPTSCRASSSSVVRFSGAFFTADCVQRAGQREELAQVGR